MKSYGTKWIDSLVKINVYVVKEELKTSNKEEVLSIELKGTHKSKTSVTYSNIHTINPMIKKGSNLFIHIQLVGGTFFKFTGMAFCYK